MNVKLIGQNVKKFRTKSKLTQSQTAEQANVSTIHISHIETGVSVMSLDCLLNLCAVFLVTPNDILQGAFEIKDKAASAMVQRAIEGLSSDNIRLLLEIADSMHKIQENKE